MGLKKQACRIFLRTMKELRIDKFIPDRIYLKLLYRRVFDKPLDIDHPKSFNEKLQWLKLYNRKPEYTVMVDKCAVKKYVANIIGEKYIIPTIGVWDTPEEIEWDKLPDQFVLKCTHDSGGLVICRDKSKLDKNSAIKKLHNSLKRDYYLADREWPYKNVPRRIIAEKYMEDSTSLSKASQDLVDYKFFCFNGEPKLMFIATDRSTDTRFDYFDMDFNHLPFEQGFPHSQKMIKKPERWADMVKIAKRLSQKLPHVRIDLYEINGEIYFGEYTFFHNSGFVPFIPEAWDYKLGEYINIP